MTDSPTLREFMEVKATAQAAKEKGASRFCMGAAWRGPKDKDMGPVLDMVRAVKALGLETCVTLGMLKEGQAQQLRDAGLDYYNHNLDTAPEFYEEVERPGEVRVPGRSFAGEDLRRRRRQRLQRHHPRRLRRQVAVEHRRYGS